MSNYFSFSGVHIYKEPLHKKKPPVLAYFFFIFLFGLLGLYIFFSFLAPIEEESNISSQNPANYISPYNKIVTEEGIFVSGKFRRPVKEINYKDAKVKSPRKMVPVISKMLYKETLSAYAMNKRYFLSFHLKNFQKFRETKLSAYDTESAESIKYSKRELFSQSMNYDKLNKRGSYISGTNYLRYFANSLFTQTDFFIKKKSKLKLKTKNTNISLSYMINFDENRALYHNIRVEVTENGILNVPGKGIETKKGSYVFYSYFAGVPPYKCLIENAFAILSDTSKQNEILISITKTTPKAKRPADAFFYTKGSWTAIEDAEISFGASGRTLSLVSAKYGINLNFIPENIEKHAKGIIFPRITHKEYHGFISGKVRINGTNEYFEGRAIRVHEKGFW